MVFTGKRILIIVENLPVPFDKRVWNEAHCLREAGYSVSIISPIGKGFESRYEEIDGIAVFRHPLPLEANGLIGYLLEYSSSLFWEFLLAVKVHFSRGFDVIHACNPPDTIFLIGLFFKLFGKRFVFDHHDINPELFVAKFGKTGLLYKVISMLERLTFATADISIATNQSYREIAIKRGHMNPSKVFVVRSGPDLEKFVPVPPRPELKQGRTYLVCYVGVMGKQEGLNYLLDAAKFVLHAKQRKDILFVLIGSGPEYNNLRTYGNSLGLDRGVIFTGRIPDKELIEYLSTSDICVNPDAVNEMNDKSTMNKIMEYMAMAKPIVQFEMTEGRFSAQGASLYARPNDSEDFGRKVIELLDDPARCKSMGHLGRERVVRELQWTHEKKGLLQAYSQLFEK